MSKPLRFLHIGDLHVTEAGLQNHLHLRRIVDEINRETSGKLDFVYLPGDVADDGTDDQFGIVFEDVSRLRLPWYAIPGDHDFKPKSLDSFYKVLGCPQLPFARELSGCVCLFLDVVSAGTGGPDFRLGRDQMAWLRTQLDDARRAGKSAAIFMHAYPADLGDEAAEVAALIDDSPVVLVEMGHTHYNELSNDGRTIYAATRSTGQIEEGDGAAGFAFATIDDGVVSWRFKPVDSPWPFVMITSPADRRLAVAPWASKDADLAEVKAAAWGAAPVTRAEFQTDGQTWKPMTGGGDGIFSATFATPTKPVSLSVRVTDQQGNQDTDTIMFAPHEWTQRTSTGSDAGSIGAWPERHLFGTQLGPNRNGKKW